MKTPKLKARRMWANYYFGKKNAYVHRTKEIALEYGDASAQCVPVAVIPLDDVEGLVQDATRAFIDAEGYGPVEVTAGDAMRSVLTAIGVLPRARKGGRK